MEDVSSQALLKRYAELLKLYEKLEEISQEVFHVLEAGSHVGELTLRLRENAVVANQISEESQAIVSIKKTLAEKKLLTERDKSLVRESEEHLTRAVNRVVEQENKSRELMKKQGVKISRK